MVGPKRIIGWGWMPLTWLGGAVCGAFLILVAASLTIWPGVGGGIAAIVWVAC